MAEVVAAANDRLEISPEVETAQCGNNNPVEPLKLEDIVDELTKCGYKMDEETKESKEEEKNVKNVQELDGFKAADRSRKNSVSSAKVSDEEVGCLILFVITFYYQFIMF